MGSGRWDITMSRQSSRLVAKGPQKSVLLELQNNLENQADENGQVFENHGDLEREGNNDFNLFLLTEESGEVKQENFSEDLDSVKTVPGEYHVTVMEKEGGNTTVTTLLGQYAESSDRTKRSNTIIQYKFESTENALLMTSAQASFVPRHLGSNPDKPSH